jgi:hypothetical protein
MHLQGIIGLQLFLETLTETYSVMFDLLRPLHLSSESLIAVVPVTLYKHHVSPLDKDYRISRCRDAASCTD